MCSNDEYFSATGFDGLTVYEVRRKISDHYVRFLKVIDIYSQENQHINDTKVHKLVVLTLEYLDLLCTFILQTTMSCSVYEELKVYLSIMEKIAKINGIPNSYIENITVPIWEKVVDPSSKVWFGKELLRNFNNFVHLLDREKRCKITENNKMCLMKLVDLMCGCGDLPYQVVIMETITRMCSLTHISEYAHDFFPSAPHLESAFLKIELGNFDTDLRTFLNILNLNDNKVYSVDCFGVKLGRKSISGPSDGTNSTSNVWLDFNMTTNSISIMCDRNSIKTLPDSQNSFDNHFDFDILTVPVDEINLVTTGNLIREGSSIVYGALFCFELQNSCYVMHSNRDETINENSIYAYIENSERLTHLDKKILPKIFGSKYINKQSCQETSSQQSSVQLPGKLKVSRTAMSKASLNVMKLYKPLKVAVKSRKRTITRSFVSLESNTQDNKRSSTLLDGKVNEIDFPDSTVPDDLSKSAELPDRFSIRHRSTIDTRIFNVTDNSMLMVDLTCESDDESTCNNNKDLSAAAHSATTEVLWRAVDQMSEIIVPTTDEENITDAFLIDSNLSENADIALETSETPNEIVLDGITIASWPTSDDKNISENSLDLLVHSIVVNNNSYDQVSPDDEITEVEYNSMNCLENKEVEGMQIGQSQISVITISSESQMDHSDSFTEIVENNVELVAKTNEPATEHCHQTELLEFERTNESVTEYYNQANLLSSVKIVENNLELAAINGSVNEPVTEYCDKANLLSSVTIFENNLELAAINGSVNEPVTEYCDKANLLSSVEIVENNLELAAINGRTNKPVTEYCDQANLLSSDTIVENNLELPAINGKAHEPITEYCDQADLLSSVEIVENNLELAAINGRTNKPVTEYCGQANLLSSDTIVENNLELPAINEKANEPITEYCDQADLLSSVEIVENNLELAAINGRANKPATEYCDQANLLGSVTIVENNLELTATNGRANELVTEYCDQVDLLNSVKIVENNLELAAINGKTNRTVIEHCHQTDLLRSTDSTSINAEEIDESKLASKITVNRKSYISEISDSLKNTKRKKSTNLLTKKKVLNIGRKRLQLNQILLKTTNLRKEIKQMKLRKQILATKLKRRHVINDTNSIVELHVCNNLGKSICLEDITEENTLSVNEELVQYQQATEKLVSSSFHYAEFQVADVKNDSKIIRIEDALLEDLVLNKNTVNFENNVTVVKKSNIQEIIEENILSMNEAIIQNQQTTTKPSSITNSIGYAKSQAGDVKNDSSKVTTIEDTLNKLFEDKEKDLELNTNIVNVKNNVTNDNGNKKFNIFLNLNKKCHNVKPTAPVSRRNNLESIENIALDEELLKENLPKKINSKNPVKTPEPNRNLNKATDLLQVSVKKTPATRRLVRRTLFTPSTEAYDPVVIETSNMDTDPKIVFEAVVHQEVNDLPLAQERNQTKFKSTKREEIKQKYEAIVSPVNLHTIEVTEAVVHQEGNDLPLAQERNQKKIKSTKRGEIRKTYEAIVSPVNLDMIEVFDQSNNNDSISRKIEKKKKRTIQQNAKLEVTVPIMDDIFDSLFDEPIPKKAKRTESKNLRPSKMSKSHSGNSNFFSSFFTNVDDALMSKKTGSNKISILSDVSIQSARIRENYSPGQTHDNRESIRSLKKHLSTCLDIVVRLEENN